MATKHADVRLQRRSMSGVRADLKQLQQLLSYGSPACASRMPLPPPLSITRRPTSPLRTKPRQSSRRTPRRLPSSSRTSWALAGHASIRARTKE